MYNLVKKNAFDLTLKFFVVETSETSQICDWIISFVHIKDLFRIIHYIPISPETFCKHVHPAITLYWTRDKLNFLLPFLEIAGFWFKKWFYIHKTRGPRLPVYQLMSTGQTWEGIYSAPSPGIGGAARWASCVAYKTMNRTKGIGRGLNGLASPLFKWSHYFENPAALFWKHWFETLADCF